MRAYGSRLMDLDGIGPAGAARLLVDVATITRFPTKGHFASWNGTAPLDASCGEQIRHRLSGAGNRRINHVLHITAIVQLRNDTPGRAYYRRLLARGKTAMEALRCLKRRLSDAVYRQMLADQLAGWHQDRPRTGRGKRAREDTRGRLLTPARTTWHPQRPSLRTSHFPDPPPTTLPRTRARRPRGPAATDGEDGDEIAGPAQTIDPPAVTLVRRARAGQAPACP